MPATQRRQAAARQDGVGHDAGPGGRVGSFNPVLDHTPAGNLRLTCSDAAAAAPPTAT